MLDAGWKQDYSHFHAGGIPDTRIDPAYRTAEIAQWLDDEPDPSQEKPTIHIVSPTTSWAASKPNALG